MQTADPIKLPAITDAMVTAAARKLSDIQAEACEINAADNWAMFGASLKEDARDMLKAAWEAAET